LSRTSLSSCSQEVTLSVEDQTLRHWCLRLKRLCTCATSTPSSRRVLPCGVAARVDQLARI
jgi:hypothetical protein